MIKHLVPHGNSKALVIDKALLQAAGLTDKTAFQVTISPNGLIIQNVSEEATSKEFKEVADKLIKNKSKLWKNLANR